MRDIDCNLWATAMVEHVHYSASVVLSEFRCAAFEPCAVRIEVDEVHALFVETRPGHHLAQILMGGVGAAVGIHGYERIDDLLSRTTFDATRWEGRRWCVRRGVCIISDARFRPASSWVSMTAARRSSSDMTTSGSSIASTNSAADGKLATHE